MEVTNRFKGLDLVQNVPEKLWTEACNICPGGGDQNRPQEGEMHEGKVVV